MKSILTGFLLGIVHLISYIGYLFISILLILMFLLFWPLFTALYIESKIKYSVNNTTITAFLFGSVVLSIIWDLFIIYISGVIWMP